jgi:hypothetical protein
LASAALALVAASGPEKSNTDIFRTWLAAYHQGDPAVLEEFQETYWGESDVAYALDTREASGGFDLNSTAWCSTTLRSPTPPSCV